MPSNEKILLNIISGTHDKNIKFRDLQRVLEALGFEERIRGDHHIYTYKECPEIINIQPRGNLSKPYQVKQIRELILKYHLYLGR